MMSTSPDLVYNSIFHSVTLQGRNAILQHESLYDKKYRTITTFPLDVLSSPVGRCCACGEDEEKQDNRFVRKADIIMRTPQDYRAKLMFPWRQFLADRRPGIPSDSHHARSGKQPPRLAFVRLPLITMERWIRLCASFATMDDASRWAIGRCSGY